MLTHQLIHGDHGMMGRFLFVGGVQGFMPSSEPLFTQCFPSFGSY